MKRREVRQQSFTDRLKEDLDFILASKDVESKVGMAEEIIYSIIKMATGDDTYLAIDLLQRTTVSIYNNATNKNRG